MLNNSKLIDAAPIMERLNYRDRNAFYQMARRTGLPFIKLSRKRIVFDETSVERWLISRQIGKLPPGVN